MEEILPKVNYLFEASWEVCNKVGGIYTVIKEKAPFMLKYYKNYYCLGPYLENKTNEFMELNPPKDFLNIFEKLKLNEGIKCFYGKWKIKGEPSTILVDFKSLLPKKNTLKYELWDKYKIDSLRSGYDFEEPMLWSYATSVLLHEIEKIYKSHKIVLHCHEWLSGFIILYLKLLNSKIKTVFTTHATMVGRALSGVGENFYELLPTLEPIKEAYRLKIEGKFLTEKSVVNVCDVFTTVSEVVKDEVEKLFGRKPDLLLINGMNTEDFPTIEETSIKHITSRDRIREFLRYFFLPYYKFDVTKTLLFYISCRYEFRNKGIDIFIEALGKLNKKLIEENSEINVVTFFWVPMSTKCILSTLLENKEYYYHIESVVKKNLKNITTKIIDEFISMKKPEEFTFQKELMNSIMRESIHFKRTGNPPILTHIIENEEDDLIIKALKSNGLDNSENNKVKVIVYPVYLTGDDNLIALPYYDTIAGCHLGIFPSYYEPWGYTPLESGALGVPAVTSDLSGFGRFIETNFPKREGVQGIFVLKRLNIKRDKVIDSLYEILYNFVHMSKEERVANKIKAKELSSTVEWKHQIKNYIKAHNLAIESFSSD